MTWKIDSFFLLYLTQAATKTLDFIVDAASGDHPFDPYMSTLKTRGVLVLVGFPSEVKFSPANLNLGTADIIHLKYLKLGSVVPYVPSLLSYCGISNIPLIGVTFSIVGMKTVSGSITGGTREIQEMIDFCAAKKIHPMIEVVPIQYANEALERMIKRDVKYRFVLDIESSLK